MSVELPDDGQAKTLQAPVAWWANKTILAALIGPAVVLLALFTKIDLRNNVDTIINGIMALGVLVGAVTTIIAKFKDHAPIAGTQKAAETIEIRKAIAVDPEFQAKVVAAREAANPKA